MKMQNGNKYKTKIAVAFVTVIFVIVIAFLINYINEEPAQEVVAKIATNVIEVEVIKESAPKKDEVIIFILEPEEIEVIEEVEQEEENTEPQEEQHQESTERNRVNNAQDYYIKVNVQENVVTIYTKDESGNYSIPYKAILCSTGDATPKEGVYNLDYKYRWLALFGNVYGQYAYRIVGNILFHSVPYLENGNPATLKYEEYDKLGESVSAGCVRMTVENVLWIYNNCKPGTGVEFYKSSDPGPLGKPTEREISNEPEPYRNWDPTDPDTNNPWNH